MSMWQKSKITVYIPCHNYGEYLAKAVDSVIRQIERGWELIIVDDGSTDSTSEIAGAYAALHPEQIRFVRNETPKKLIGCANVALEMARGEYFMRLDADDFLDESALLVMSAYLDNNPDTALVFPNYFYVDHEGNYLRVENRKKIGSESKLLDLPAHGACTMVRKRVLKSVGGYTESLQAQDGHDLWLKIIGRYQVANIETALFYYRQHDRSLSRDGERLLSNRRRVKRMMAARSEGSVSPRIVGIVPVKNTYTHTPNVALRDIGGKSLLDYTLDQAAASGLFDAVFVSTDDPAVAEHCRSGDGVIVSMRPEALSQHHVRFSHVVHDAVDRLEQEHQIFPDIVVALSVHTPMRRPEQIVEAVDTLRLYDSDSVISVCEATALHFRHGQHGLEPLNPAMANNVQLDRETLYVENRSIRAMWRDLIEPDDIFGTKISHIVMSERDSVAASSEENIERISTMIHAVPAAKPAEPQLGITDEG